MPLVALEKFNSNTEKHHTNTVFLAIEACQIFKERMKKDMDIESSCAERKCRLRP